METGAPTTAGLLEGAPVDALAALLSALRSARDVAAAACACAALRRAADTPHAWEGAARAELALAGDASIGCTAGAHARTLAERAGGWRNLLRAVRTCDRAHWRELRTPNYVPNGEPTSTPSVRHLPRCGHGLPAAYSGGRWGHSMVAFGAGGLAAVFGGRAADDSLMDCIDVLDCREPCASGNRGCGGVSDTMRAVRVLPASGSARPAARYGHIAVCARLGDHDFMVVHGGLDANSAPRADVWGIELPRAADLRRCAADVIETNACWMQLVPDVGERGGDDGAVGVCSNGGAPCARWQHAAVVLVARATRSDPGAASGTASTRDECRVLICGGVGKSGKLGDTRVLCVRATNDGALRADWEADGACAEGGDARADGRGASSLPRRSALALASPGPGEAPLAFGGLGERSQRRGDVWRCSADSSDGAACLWNCAMRDASGDAELMGCTPAWAEALHASLPELGPPRAPPRVPQGRKGAVMSPLRGTRAMLLHGGWGETYELLEDSWLLAMRPSEMGAEAPSELEAATDGELRWVRATCCSSSGRSESAQSAAPAWRRDFYGGRPAAREMAASCEIGPGAVLLYGGRGAHGAPLADAWRFEIV